MNKFINNKNVKEYISDKYNLRVSKDYFERIDMELGLLIDASCVRADKNFRSTVMSKDL